MPVNAKSKKYSRFLEQWQRCRDVLSGQDAIHAAGTKYLPMLKEQSQEEYLAYVKRTTFYNATFRTVAGLRGMLLEKEPVIEVAESVRSMLEDVTLSGSSFLLFLTEVIYQVLGISRAGILVDYPEVSENYVPTQADARRLKLQPMMQLYRAESIINWRCGYVGAIYTLTMVVLEETELTAKDEFEYEERTVYRVLDLPNGVYRVRKFYIDPVSKKDVQIGDDLFPKMGNQSLGYIPFTFIGPDGAQPEPEEPQLIDLVDLNLSHYRTVADREHGAHFCGLPTPWVAGYTATTGPDGTPEKLYIGSSKAWIFPDPNAKAGYLEFTGQGLSALAELQKDKEKQMAILGARMLEEQTRAKESPESQQIKRKGEESMLAATADSISEVMTLVMRWFSAWAGADPNQASVKINKEFYLTGMAPAMLQALVGGWQNGAYSDQVLFYNLQRGEVIPADLTLEKMQEQINSAPPKFAPMLPGFPAAPVKEDDTPDDDPQDQ